MTHPAKRLWDKFNDAAYRSPYTELDPIEGMRNRLVDKLPEGIQLPFRSGPSQAREILSDPLGNSPNIRALGKIRDRFMPEPSMGTEILGERGAPYQDIGEQHRMNEALIRLLMQEGNPLEYGGPVTPGAPLPAAPGPYSHGVPADNQPTPEGPLESLEMRNLPRRPSRETGWEFEPY